MRSICGARDSRWVRTQLWVRTKGQQHVPSVTYRGHEEGSDFLWSCIQPSNLLSSSSICFAGLFWLHCYKTKIDYLERNSFTQQIVSALNDTTHFSLYTLVFADLNNCTTDGSAGNGGKRLCRLKKLLAIFIPFLPGHFASLHRCLSYKMRHFWMFSTF